MYNSKQPKDSELPTSKQLIRSTIIAFLVAVVILLIAVLPAEYGIDVTGAGTALGLQKMGEIKVSLEKENETVVIAPVIEKISPAPLHAIDPLIKTDTITFTLEPGQKIEYKLTMDTGAKVRYEWFTTNGRLNHDTHGDGPSNAFISYKKGRMIHTDKGELIAAFKGSHGWFWRNRDNQPVNATLTVKGAYHAIKKML
ncbi:MAG: hypothetical protein OCC49_19845 [Fibrobacterales bacterium]